ncbi:ankyrin repeat and LEM domain-containing protein 2 [Linepithema humile]|uniref:ankyrin repeat and LEM domain-containing protein 2 n=1 Tax=Linepithema humile TaxID=83485 RepID=UPI0006231CFD|nr:PREDICTED: ankyrin repeat and LEM domain-containing protein 2 [Linepithema humile]
MSYFHKHVTVLGSIESLWYLKLASYQNFINLFNEEFEEKVKMNESEKTETQSACDTRSNLSNETVFHAVYIPQDKDSPDEDTKECIHIYEDMPSALLVIKTHKKARLKTFRNRLDAEAYAKSGQEQSTNYSAYSIYPSIVVTQEKSSNFKAPKPQELVGFKKLIESGDMEAVKSTVWENPRYLISSGDTPAILQMGSRYNALHIAARSDKPQMCEFILNTVGDPKFIQWHFGETDCRSNLDPAQIMLDLYLNTPDKGLNETPLHLAVKFGYKDVVRVLVSYSQCIKTLPNKYKQLPMEIICSRKCQEDEDLKREIRMLLEDQFYVPVLRAEGNACPPIIGEPFSPTNPLNLNSDPMSPRVEVRAFAGPMNKSQAVEFRRKWKTPPRLTPKKGQGDVSSIISSPSLALRLEDTEKGLERVGRDLAEECQVPWKEYWPFLKDFVDFRGDEGLMKLEKYLEQRFQNKYKNQNYTMRSINSAMQKLINNPNENEPANCQQTSEKMNAVCEMKTICRKFQSLSVENDEIEENIEFFTPPSSPELQNDSDDDMQNAEEGLTTFIEGFSPTKLDYAVYNALSTAISPDTYPHIYYWRHDMKLVIKRDPNRFNKTNLLRRKLFHNN